MKYLFLLILVPQLAFAFKDVFRVEGAPRNIMGTAVSIFVNNKVLTITNRHICEGNVSLIADVSGKPKILLIKRLSNLDDLCELSPISETGYSLAKGYEIGDAVTIIGYPNDEFKITRGSLQGFSFNTKMNTLFLRSNAESDFGSSGSPALNKNSELIGLVKFVSASSYKEFAGLVPLERIKEFLGLL